VIVTQLLPVFANVLPVAPQLGTAFLLPAGCLALRLAHFLAKRRLRITLFSQHSTGNGCHYGRQQKILGLVLEMSF
jgi:hypothetical protein